MKNLATSASFKSILAKAQHLESVRDFDKMAEIITPIWNDYSIRPNTQALSPKLKAEFLRLCGYFLVCYSRTKGIPELQEQAKDLLSEAEELFRNLNDVSGQGRCACHLAISYYYDGRYEEALIIANEAQNLFQSNSTNDTFLHIKISQLVALARLEKFNECVSIIQEIGDRVEASENPFIQILFFNHAGYVFSHSEDHHIAIKMYTEAVEISEKAKDERSLSQSLNNLADALRREGQANEAVKYACRSIALATKLEDRGFLSIFEDTKANILLALGNTDAALRSINLTLADLRKSGEIPTQCEALWTKIEILLSSGQHKHAVFNYGELCDLSKKYLGEKIAESYAAKLVDRLTTQPNNNQKFPTEISRFYPENQKITGVPAEENKLFLVPANFASVIGRNSNIVACTIKDRQNPFIMQRGETGKFFLGYLKPDDLFDFNAFILKTSEKNNEVIFSPDTDFIEGRVVAVAEYSEETLIFENI